MTLRDYFAAKALPAVITAEYAQGPDYIATTASLAYRYADAMLAERDRTTEGA